MKLNYILSLSAVLCAFAAGCAVDSQSNDTTQTDESSEALRRAQVVGTFARAEHASVCNGARTIELKSNGTFIADMSYSGPNVLCAAVVAAPIRGTFTVNSSNRITFRPAGRRASFSLKFVRGVLSDLRGQRADFGFEGSYRKLAQGQCVSDAGCASSEECLFPMYASSGSNGGSSDASPLSPPDDGTGFLFPAVPVGQCVTRGVDPEEPIVCSSINGLHAPCPIGYTCVEPQIHPCAPGQTCGGRVPEGICVPSNDPVEPPQPIICASTRGFHAPCPTGYSCLTPEYDPSAGDNVSICVQN